MLVESGKHEEARDGRTMRWPNGGGDGRAWGGLARGTPGSTSGVGRTAEEWGVRWTGQGSETRLGLAGIMPRLRRPWQTMMNRGEMRLLRWTREAREG